MRDVLMYNLGKDNLKGLEVKAIQKDFNALKFKSAIILYLLHIFSNSCIALAGFGNIPNFVPTLFSYLCDLIPSQAGIATL